MNLKDETVLVIDDDKVQLEMAEKILSSFEIQHIIKANNGLKGLEALENEPKISIILLDIMMPEMDGAKFLHHLSQLNKSVRIILVSGIDINALKSIANSGCAQGLNIVGILRKPLLPETLKPKLFKNNRKKHYCDRLENSFLDMQELINALSSNEIFPWYQPKVDIKSFRVVGVEALARWVMPDGAMISPSVFIPEIEKAGLSDMLFFSILEKVLKDMQKWKASGRPIRTSVNITIDCTFNPSLPNKIYSLLKAYKIDPTELIFEITESRILSNKSGVVQNLQKITDMGIVLSIDDFGTGYSSLSQVASLPCGELKIDGSFVRQSGDGKKSDAILQSTITLGRSLGLDLVAEGVETHEQLDNLENMGVDIVQGYLIAKPMESMVFEQWLFDWRPGTISQPGTNRSVSILIVDDDRAIRLYLEAIFKDNFKDTKVFTAKNGRQAVEIMKKHPIDAATLDFHMPGLNGIDLLRLLRNTQPATRYVLLTGDTHENVAREASNLGALYCPKELINTQLIRMFRFFNIFN